MLSHKLQITTKAAPRIINNHYDLSTSNKLLLYYYSNSIDELFNNL